MYVLFYFFDKCHCCSNIMVESDLEDSATVLCKRHQDIVKAVKTFNKRKKSTQNDIVDEDLDDEGE